ncbi:IncF plasmid conjugative transfer protein TrbI [Salmonella enterica subsp. arizonae]|nr:IncF plasmid conjugative transfer protein TrbI [Salmonella enterica subsp. arizonae]
MKTEQVNDTQSKPTTARKALTQRERQRRRCLRSLLLVAATILCINAAVTSVLISWRMPVVVSFDMKKNAGSVQLNRLALSHWMEPQTKALTERFMTSLNAELQDWQVRHDALILVTPAVVSGAGDITDEIQTGVAHRMAAGGGN